MARCAAEGCNAKVEDGAVRCPSCGADLSSPGAFLQTLGYVVLALSMIPLAIYAVVWETRNYIPAVLGTVGAAAGICMIIVARTNRRVAAPRVVPDREEEESALL